MSEQLPKTVLVTGATGNQGGAVARRLLADGWHVRALTRDPAAPSARRLAAAGAEVVGGDLADRTSLAAAVQGAHGVFSVQRGALATPPVPAEDEIRQAVNVIEAALTAGVAHLVQSTVAGAEPGAPAAFAAKAAIEERLRAAGAPATVLRPVSFMENYADPAFGVQTGTLATPFAPDTPEQLIALDDIGAFAALAFADPDTYLGRTLDIAGDALTPPRIAAALSTVTGRHIAHQHIPVDAVRRIRPEAAEVFDYLNGRGGYGADIAAARVLNPRLLDFTAWLALRGAAAVRSLLDAPVA